MNRSSKRIVSNEPAFTELVQHRTKRVARALDKLRDLLAQRSIRTAAAALSVVISANAVPAAPPPL